MGVCTKVQPMPRRAKCTVLVIQLFLANCVQAHDIYLEVLQHIILYLSTSRPQITGHPAFFYGTDIGESLCTVPGLHRERAKGDAPTIRDRRRPNFTLYPL